MSTVNSNSRWRTWLIAALAGVAIVVASALVFVPQWPPAGIASVLIGIAIVLVILALTTPPPVAEQVLPAPVTTAVKQAPAAIPPAILQELESLRAIQGELLAARQEAEAATMAKGEFLATMSHEIRTPLNGIVPLLDILRSTPLQPDQREYLATAYQSAMELLRIVDDILDFSKLEASKLELESVGVNLKELVDSVAKLMQGSATAKGLRLGVVIDPSVRLAVRGDPVRLRQVLTNLVSNAVKFTERGSVTIQIGKRGETRTHHEVTFAVRDTGIGLTEEAAARLFKPFTQADASTTRVFGGTGLGLVICKRLVDLMGGKIGVRSEPGRGSVFWFNVPLQKAIGDIRTRTDLAGVRALILSGNEAFIRRSGSLLSQLGMSHLHSNLAVDALTRLRSSSAAGESWGYEFLLIDVATVGSATIALVRNIRRDPSLDQLRIVIAGSHEGVQDLRSDERQAAISESFDERELRETLSRLLGIGQVEINREGPLLATPMSADEVAAQEPAAYAKLHGRALLVEDNPVNLKVANRLLILLGIEVDSATDGSIALKMLAENQYDLILMDCQMPVMDGYTAARKRREDEKVRNLPHLPIIAMTANAMVGDREKCLAAGMDDYLTKPLNRPLLYKTLAHWLETSSAQATSAPTVVPTKPAPSQSVPSAVFAAPPASQFGAAPASAAVSPTAAPPVDQATVQELLEIMGEGFSELVQVYFDDTPKLLARLRQAAGDSDHEIISEVTHSLKSSSANVGALPLAELARNAEVQAKARRSDELGSLPQCLDNEYRRVLEAFAGIGLVP
ncbi:MAG TPA: ATP-binding protein [Dokdonella sp.]|uniref:hybrid sensor histidine kinase/response regulator n=1 Tax=Dokdonella sp. TaxID=2291710 RepID=UPI002D7E967C|nr:ATP-binding protein [Dokdonella sp.]HET9033288.1 ATP-binding protein [Dokdonella sp.]